MFLQSRSCWLLLILIASVNSPLAAQTKNSEPLEKITITDTPPASLKGRFGASKDSLLKNEGASAETEAGVVRGLAWLAKQQKEDGHWEFDGSDKDQIAATSLALLPFLGAGIPLGKEVIFKEYPPVVEKGIVWLCRQQTKNGDFKGTDRMISHAMATIALIECYGLTQDPKLKPYAMSALDFIVKNQSKDGSWGQKVGATGETMVVTWQISALRAARTRELKVEQGTFDKAKDFLISVSTESESRYRPSAKEEPTAQSTAAGLLCRVIMGMGSRNPSLANGIKFLKETLPTEAKWDIEYYFFATEVFYTFGGPTWEEQWHPHIKWLLIKLQSREGDATGSWKKDKGKFGELCGTLGTTSLAALTLEVYYRYPRFYKREKDALDELEK